MTKPFFSVIIPSFNRLKFLFEAINSVENQIFQDFEIIVIDDASTDGTDILSKNNGTIRYIRNSKNMGVSYSRNQGLILAKGKYICFLDSDDLWLENKLEKQFEYIRNNNFPELIHTNEKWLRNGIELKQLKKHKKQGGKFIERQVQMCLVSPSSVAIRHDIFTKYGNFDEKLIVCEDYDLWLRLNLKFPFHYLEEVLLIKRGGHEDQLSNTYFAMDRFRIISMKKILQAEAMTEEIKKIFIDEIMKKLTILLKGARKHNNHELINFCQREEKFIKSIFDN